MTVTYSGRLGERYTNLGTQTHFWVKKAKKNTFQISFFQLHFNTKYAEVGSNDFTMHLIISNWFRI